MKKKGISCGAGIVEPFGMGDGDSMLNRSQMRVFEVMDDYPGISAKGVARLLKIGFNRVSGRVTELSRMGMIEPINRVKAESGRNVALWKVKHYM